MGNEREFNKQTIIDAINDEYQFDDWVKDFLINSNIITYSFTDEDRKVLKSIMDPHEFTHAYLELALERWFTITMGE